MLRSGRCPRLRHLAAIDTDAVDIEAVIGDLVTGLGGDGALALFDGFIHELIHPAAFHADDMVMMRAFVEFEDRMATFKMVSGHQTRRLELGKHSVDRRQTDVFALIQQRLVDIFGAHVAVGLVALQEFQDFHPGQRDLQAGFA